MLQKMKYVIRPLATGVFLSALSACAPTSQLSYKDVLQRHDEIVALQSHLQQAEQNGVTYLAPTGYRKSQVLRDQAIEAGQKQQGNTNALATQGFKTLAKAEKDAETSRRVMREVLITRDRALQAQAPRLEANQFLKLEQSLKNATTHIERSNIDRAKQARPELIAGYAQVELAALKKDTVQAARNSIVLAKRREARYHAPKTFKRAEDEFKLAIEVLNADRSQTEKADKHALNAQQLANRSRHITDLVKNFHRRNYSKEDMVLWYQDQLVIVNEPYANALLFDESNHEVVTQLRGKAVTRSVALESSQQKQAETRASQAFDQATQSRFNMIQSLFHQSEAEVYRQGQNVLLVTHAFNFPVGKAEIQAENFELLHKIMESVKAFDSPRVEVSGHTDASGSAEKNEALSYMRAENVVTFLREINDIPIGRVIARGLGEQHPVASNETREGRARNRRIEVLIVDE